MKRKNFYYKFEDKFSTSKFFSAIKLDLEEVEDSDNELVDVEMLRVGTFKHKIYGDMDITTEMLETMVKNFHDNVIGREVSFDWNHEAKKASAWLRDVRVEDGVLIGSIELTKSGKESIENKEYAYFSIEFADDYEDPETEKTFGPTIVGGALTNRPFITNLKKITFENSDLDLSLFRLEDENMDKDRDTKNKKDVKRTPVRLSDEEIAKKLEEQKETNKKLQEFIESQQKLLENVTKELKTLQEENKNLATKHKESERRARIAEIENKCEKLLTEGHHHPSVVEVVKQLMMADVYNSMTIKFSETIEVDGEQKSRDVELTFSEALEKVLEAIPQSQRANYGEKTVIGSPEEISEEEAAKLEDKAIEKVFSKRKIKRLSVIQGGGTK